MIIEQKKYVCGMDRPCFVFILLEQARGSGTFVREKGKKQSCYQNAKQLVDELYAMHLTEEEILRLASEILLGQMDN